MKQVLLEGSQYPRYLLKNIITVIWKPYITHLSVRWNLRVALLRSVAGFIKDEAHAMPCLEVLKLSRPKHSRNIGACTTLKVQMRGV